MNNITKNIEIRDLALYLKKEKSIIITDLQLGYEENLLKRGVLVPFNHLKDLKERLDQILKNLSPEKIIINGDLKHEFGKISKQEWKEVSEIIDFLFKYTKKLIIVKGNHDVILEPITKKKNIEIVENCIIGDILITHGHDIPEIPKNIKTIIIGHEHPAVSISEDDVKEIYKCYLKGKYRNKILIVQPSSFLLNEGTDILNYEPNSPFIKSFDNFEVWAVADKTYYFGRVKNFKI